MGHAASQPDAAVGYYADEPALWRLQLRTFTLTWLSYASFYFTRKNLSVVKSRLHDDLGLSTAQLGGIDTLYLSFYALGQFVNGALGDRIGPRRLLTLGMLGSAVMALWFGCSSSVWVFALAFACNGLFQSTGWPGNVKAMQPFFPSWSRGRVMGLWTTNYQAGGLLSTALATFLLVHHGWRAAFLVPALWVALIGGMVRLFLVERPEHHGLPPLEPEPPCRGQADADRPNLFSLLRMPLLWAIGGAYFGLKLIRYSLLFWLPYYLKQHLHYSEGQAGYLSMPFEVGGILGSIVVGWLSDRFFRTRRMRLAVPLVFCLGGALLAYQALGGVSVWVNALLLAGVGFLLFGPDALISGSVAQDLGGRHATARVAGIINGMGSAGALGSLVVVLSSRYGWKALFYGFISITQAAALLLALATYLNQARLRQAQAAD